MTAVEPVVENRLRRYADLLLERSVPLGFVSERDRARIWSRHVLDSLRAIRWIPPRAREAADIGSGAGLPGVVVAIARPDLLVALIDAQRRRVAFLELVIAELGLANASAVHSRAEDAVLEVDVAFARAVGSINEAWRLAAPMLRPHGPLLYFAGRSWSPSVTAPAGTTMNECDDGRNRDVGPIVMITAPGGTCSPGG
jgi:16S rRNA (guanine527-N7)-methyltransferase